VSGVIQASFRRPARRGASQTRLDDGPAPQPKSPRHRPDGVQFAPAPAENPEEAKLDVTVDMTLTSQGCPEHVNISAQVKSRLEQLPGIRNATVNVVWTPAWTPERLSPDARKQLGIE